jgi:asparagine synthase (glutamine-hydrolysing)
MSALAALLSRDGRPADPAAVRAMLHAVPYRGPDGADVRAWPEHGVVLGHAKMAVTPEDIFDHQPLVSARTGCAIVADVRLDNRDELIERLAGDVPATASDADLILRAYDAWGLEALPRLLGDFAFTIWDPRERRLICARDTSGQRSLFYRIDRCVFAAASEIHQLLQDPSVPVRPNHDRIRDSLVPLNIQRNEKDRPDTYFEGIHAVPAGCVLTAEAAGTGAPEVRRYWELRPPREIRYRHDEEYAEHFRELFFEVVRARLRSAHPMGALLSGGLDSSSVVSTAQTLYRRGDAIDHGFTSFSTVFDGLACDERPFIEDTQRLYGFDTCYIPAGDEAGRLQLSPGGFVAAPNMGVAGVRDAIFGSAVERGVRAVMTGDLADNGLNGSWLIFDSFLRRLRLGAFQRHWRTYRERTHEQAAKTIALGVVLPLLPLPVQRTALSVYGQRYYRRNRGHILPAWMPDAVRDTLAERQVALDLQEIRDRRFASPPREGEYRLLYPPEVARHPVPWPVEIWRPFADRRLHAFLLAIPPEQKFLPRDDSVEFYAGAKRILRNAMTGILPESVRTRTTKTVFTASLQNEFDRQWPVLEAAFGPRAQPLTGSAGYINQHRFWSRLAELRTNADRPDATYALQILDLETWLRMFRLNRRDLVQVPAHRALGQVLPAQRAGAATA